MRARNVEKAETGIEYSQGKLNETNIAGMQQVFYQLIESETRTVMLANAKKEYVFKTVDPAVAPQEKSEPRRPLIIVLAVMLGMMVGVLIAFVRFFIADDQKNSSENMPQHP